MALEELGLGPCHHFVETFKQPDINQIMEALYHNPSDESALKTMFADFKATVDYPGCLFFEQLTKLNPEAKVILSVRDSPEAWAKSARATIFRTDAITRSPTFKYLNKICTREHGVNPSDTETDLAEMYTRWNTRVENTVSADKLLVFNVKEGWKPLCDFLGVLVPDKEFPRLNSTNTFVKNMK